jgi:hypothetical protein
MDTLWERMLREGLSRTLGVGFCIDVLAGRLTALAFGAFLRLQDALS